MLKFPKVSLLMTPSHVLWLNSPIDHDIEGLAHRDVTLCSTAVESAMEIAYRLFSSLSKWKLRTLLPYVRTLKLCNALWHAAYISSFVSCANPQNCSISESSRLNKSQVHWKCTHRLSETFQDYWRLLKTIKDYQRLSKTRNDY